MDSKTRLEEKRNVPPVIRRLLEWDVTATKQFVGFLLNFMPMRSLKTHCRFLEYSCHGVVWIACWFAFCWMIDKKELYEIEVNLMFGLIIDIIAVACIKAATRRRRPVATDDPFAMGPDKFSFPSGHASRAFLVAVFFSWLSPLPLLMWPPLFAWAFAVTLSRLLMYRHHIIDVLCGCALGVLEACVLALLWVERDTALSIMTWISDDKNIESDL